MKVEGLVAIITGGCSGLGLSACLLLLSKGCKVVMADIHPQGPSLALQHSCTFIHCDVSNESQVSSMVQQVLSLHSSIHILINSAGIIVTAPILSSKGPPSSDLLLKALKVNVVGTFNVTKYVV
jgi:NAD(P)-dependent dehydrogenase (short-subunit alcohol dehydrogenase family)